MQAERKLTESWIADACDIQQALLSEEAGANNHGI